MNPVKTIAEYKDKHLDNELLCNALASVWDCLVVEFLEHSVNLRDELCAEVQRLLDDKAQIGRSRFGWWCGGLVGLLLSGLTLPLVRKPFELIFHGRFVLGVASSLRP
jgi:hypothetical protein